MKRILLFSIGIIVFAGCGIRQREIELDKQLNGLHQREQQLNLKEQSLEFREQQLSAREKFLDSAKQKNANDSLFIRHQQLPGTWAVKMQCTETSCPGSAVGDTKNEQWEFKFQDNNVVATATSNNQLVRVYSGTFVGDILKLTVQEDSSDENSAKMIVRLQNINDKEMEGDREITQPGGCTIVYSLQLKKQ